MSDRRYRAPRSLEPSHDLSGFECGSAEQTTWLADHARQANAMGTTRVHVVTAQDSDDVLAYYAWCMASLSVKDAPPRLRAGAGRYPQPVALLARLGVHQVCEGQGLGAGLLRDVISRTAELGEEIGCRGLLIHAESESARNFYLHLVPGFEQSPTDDLHLVLLMKDIRRSLQQ